MALILSYSQQQAIKKISENNSARYDQLAKEVEECELRKLIGVAMLQDLQDNPTTASNLLLLNGTSFDYNNTTIKHKGLRYVIAYLNFSRYLGESYVSDTFTGFVKKKREEADNLSEGEIKRLQNNNRDIALTEFELIKNYLDLSQSLFPKWVACSQQIKPYTPRIYGIRKTYR